MGLKTVLLGVEMTVPLGAAVRRDIPQPSEPDETIWASDAIADMLRAMDIPYVLLNPGASFRGLHDSIVNHLGNEKPQMVVVLHEEHAVAIAHGYTKVTGQPLIAILHSNVGLMHGSMAIFDAWVDRVPVIVLGATGPVDANKRRPWIDWIHTAQDQAALVCATSSSGMHNPLRFHPRKRPCCAHVRLPPLHPRAQSMSALMLHCRSQS
jgi:hypothetical protein